MTFDYAKQITTGVWALVLFTLLADLPPTFELVFYCIGLFLVVAHIGECIAFRKQVEAKPEPAPFAYFMTFLFGVLYLRNWPTDPWHGKEDS